MSTPPTTVDGATASIAPFQLGPRQARPVRGRERRGPHPSDREVDAAQSQLAALLADAAALELTDGIGWDRLRAGARVPIDTLVAAGVLPDHLRLEPRAAATVVARTVATAWRWSQIA